MIHFEDLWNDCEKIHANETTSAILSELILKNKLLCSLISQKESISEDEYNDALSRLYGEVLFLMTQVSSVENLNVFKSLNCALKIKQIDSASILANK